MPSDSVASFLDHAQANRVLNPEQVEHIVRQPDVSRLPDLCAFLERHRVLTRFQADMIRQGRGQELHFAGYPIVDELGPCPGGTAYQALHPSLRTPLVLRRLRADWFAPADNAAAYVQRARAASTLSHPHLVPLLDAGVYRDEAYVVLEPPGDEANLEALVKEIGPMPAVLAVDFIRQATAGLRVVHERGGWHGDVRPRHLIVGPLVASPKLGPDGRPLKRPGPASATRVAELGLVPIRPSAVGDWYDAEALAFLPPERLDAVAYSARGDLYGLGASLFYLLTARAPFPGTSPDEVRHRVRRADLPPLEALRPDLPPALVALVKELLAKDPNARPATAYELEARLAPFGRAGDPNAARLGPPAAPAFIPVPVAASPFAPAPTTEAPESFPGSHDWDSAAGGSSDDFSTSESSDGPVRREVSASDRTRTRLLFLFGGLLQALAVLGWCYLAGCFDSTSQPNPPAYSPPVQNDTPKKEKETIKPKRKPRSENS